MPADQLLRDLVQRIDALERAQRARVGAEVGGGVPAVTDTGSYTPTYQGGTTGGTTTYASQFGYWARVGAILLCYGVLDWTAATGTGEARISLPFAARSDGTRRWAPSLRLAGVTYASSPPQGLLLGGASYFRLEYAISNAAANVIAVEAAGTVIWTIVYEV